ncbi:hypothetical protein MTO96_038477 [Rhipicephalus appendiculatus]
MEDVDIHRLCTICYDLLPEDAEAIYLYSFLNPSIVALHDDPIYRSLKAIDGECQRLECMAAFYSWLLPRTLHTAWALYSVHRYPSVLDAPQIGLELARKVRSVDKSAAEVVSDSEHAWCLTIMTT